MQETKLKSLEQHNAERHAMYLEADRIRQEGAATGVACPECGVELRQDTTYVLTSNPPQVRIWCPKCGYEGSMTA